MSVFKDKVSHTFHIFICLSVVPSVHHLEQGSHCFELGKPLKKTCVWPILCFPESTFNVLKISLAFLHFITKFYAHTCCSYKLAAFFGVLELQMEQYLYLTRHYATSTHALALF